MAVLGDRRRETDAGFGVKVWKGLATLVRAEKGRGTRPNAPRKPGMMRGLEKEVVLAAQEMKCEAGIVS